MNRGGTWFVLLAVCLPAACQTAAVGSSKPKQVVAQEVVISGTTTLSTEQVNEIANDLTSRRMGDSDNEVRDRIRDAFQQRGYFDAEVTSLKVKDLDALARPKPVRIEADVAEGVRFKIQSIEIAGYRAMTPDQLRKAIPIAAGELFSAGKVRGGLENLRKLYTSNGYLDVEIIPKVEKSAEGQLTIRFEVKEGALYRMGLLDVKADEQELADQLQLKWKLKQGAPFNLMYVEKFLDENRGKLPADFSPARDAYIVCDCRDMSIAVYIQMDAKRAFRPPPQDIPCEKQSSSR